MPKASPGSGTRAAAVDPDRQHVTTADGSRVVLRPPGRAPGIQLDWDGVPGMAEALGHAGGVQQLPLRPRPEDLGADPAMRSGTAVFTMPSGPIKCAGAPQKIAYLAADYWRQQGVLDDIRIVLVLPTPGMFGVKVFADELEQVVARYGIEVHKSSRSSRSTPTAGRRPSSPTTPPTRPSRRATTSCTSCRRSRPPTGSRPPPSPTPTTPRVRRGRQAHHAAHPLPERVRARRRRLHAQLQDRCGHPQAGTRSWSPTSVARWPASRSTAPLRRLRLLPADHRPQQDAARRVRLHLQPAPSFPFIDTTRERSDMWYLKRYGLPALYWNLMLKGRA